MDVVVLLGLHLDQHCADAVGRRLDACDASTVPQAGGWAQPRVSVTVGAPPREGCRAGRVPPRADPRSALAAGRGASGEKPAGFEHGVDVGALAPTADRALRVADADKPACFGERAPGEVLRRLQPLRVRGQTARPSPLADPDNRIRAGRRRSRPLALAQRATLTLSLRAQTLRGDPRFTLGLRELERVKATPKRLPVDAVLDRELAQMLTRTKPAADLLDLLLAQFRMRGHRINSSAWDISRVICLCDLRPTREVSKPGF